LSNNGGDCDGVVLAALLDQCDGDSADCIVIEILQVAGGFKPDGARFGLAALLRQRCALQESQEGGPRRVTGVGNQRQHQSVLAVA
jgi:hypothetical protein